MVESSSLEIYQAGNRLQGSNPCLSAKKKKEAITVLGFTCGGDNFFLFLMAG